MNMKRLAAVTAFLMIALTGTVLAAPVNTPEPEEKNIEYSGEYIAFDTIADYVANAYIDDSYAKEDIMAQGLSKLLENNEPLLVELLKSMLESMDDYSEFYTYDEYKEFQNQINNTFYGIGVTMKKGPNSDLVEITGFADSSDNAKNAGFRVGDEIYKVDGEDMTGRSTEYVRSKVVGEEGTTVEITVFRGKKELTFTVKRVAVTTATVTSAVLDGNIGYIQITSFNDATANEFFSALETMREQNVKKIMLDLRNNGGGLVDAAIDVAREIVPEGKIVDVKYRDNRYDVTYTSALKKEEFDFVLLVNEYTASASEILASAMQESGAAKLVGTTTYGKAVVQNIFPLQNGSVFKLTTGQYMTRNGNEINHIGLQPDEYVENVTAKVNMEDYTAFDMKTGQSLGSVHDNVKAAKEKLGLLGYYDGEIDNGFFDIKLKDALKTFQQANDMFSYGVLDVVTQEQLDNVFSELNIMTDYQFSKAYEMLGGKTE
ncbi:MAG: S41 family peptidase [Oscillospiraceae bacterium]|nr:S41 family peptidase [Oscillospiraceae bacterium]